MYKEAKDILENAIRIKLCRNRLFYFKSFSPDISDPKNDRKGTEFFHTSLQCLRKLTLIAPCISESCIKIKVALMGKLTCFYFWNFKVSFVYLAVALVPASTHIGYRGMAKNH